ncbi:hypothetical protein [Absidia glauca]|uniref:SNRNP25 ubiquitin-like domain-containing protein n=1 Tax=Absidia glauca TaxID=4829 RepID=A0A168R8L1_ABSGL|nr:hypothetical protein [Absidia glauca]
MNQDPPTENDLEQTIHALLKDPLLGDVPKRPTVQDLDDLIALELGHAYQIHIHRGALPSLSIQVSQSSTVRDIKRMFERAWTQQQQQQEAHRAVSWKYIWRTYCLEFDHQRLVKEDATVSGLHQGATLRFVRLQHDKRTHKKAWRRGK